MLNQPRDSHGTDTSPSHNHGHGHGHGHGSHADHRPGGDPCTAALTANTRDDERTSRTQQRAGSGPNKDAHLERLGWLYVEAAQGNDDHDLYLRAEQAAQCLRMRNPESNAALLLNGMPFTNFIALPRRRKSLASS